MTPAKVILATMVIFVCGLVTGVLIVKTTSPAPHSTVDTPATTATSIVAQSNSLVYETNFFNQTNLALVTKTNVVYAPFQAERMALIRQMVNKLKLDTGQRDQVAQIIKDSQERNKELWQQIAPQMHAELKRVQDEIRLVLRPGQVKRFNELMRENRRDKNTVPGGAATNAGLVPPAFTTNAPPPTND